MEKSCRFENIVACILMARLKEKKKKCEDAGLSAVLVALGITGSASISAALEGRQYSKGLRMHIILQESKFQVQSKQLKRWVVKQPGIKEEHQPVTTTRELKDCFTLEGVRELLAFPEMW